MKKQVFSFMFFLVAHASFGQLTGKSYQDSVVQFFELKQDIDYSNFVIRALADPRSTDSMCLVLYELRQIMFVKVNNNWLATKAMIDQGIILEHLGADSSLVLQKFREAFNYAQDNNVPNYMLWAAIRISKHWRVK